MAGLVRLCCNTAHDLKVEFAICLCTCEPASRFTAIIKAGDMVNLFGLKKLATRNCVDHGGLGKECDFI